MGWRHLKCFHRTSVDAEEGYVGEKDTPADRIWDPVWRQKNLHVFFWDSLWPYKKQTCGQSVASGLLNNSFQTCKENDLVKTLIFGSVGPKWVLSLWIFLPIQSQSWHWRGPEKRPETVEAQLWAETHRWMWRQWGVLVLFYRSCLCFSPLDDRGPSVPSSPPWWPQAGAAGSGTSPF